MLFDEKQLEWLDEQTKEKVRGFETVDELIAKADAEGKELTDEELEMVSGGKAPWEEEYEVVHRDHSFITTTYKPEFCEVCGKRIDW